MSEMIDKVAIAISGAPFASAASRRKAIAAIEAMREPTPAMLGAANRNNHPRDEDTWNTMIDEALK
jgi:hypothetical protein